MRFVRVSNLTRLSPVLPGKCWLIGLSLAVARTVAVVGVTVHYVLVQLLTCCSTQCLQVK